MQSESHNRLTPSSPPVLTEGIQELLIKGAKVYIAARQSQKTENAIARLQEETGKEAHLIPIDLSELKTVLAAAEMFLRSVGPFSTSFALTWHCAG